MITAYANYSMTHPVAHTIGNRHLDDSSKELWGKGSLPCSLAELACTCMVYNIFV